MVRELTSLVGENSFPDVVDFEEHILDFLALQLLRRKNLKWVLLRFGRPDIFTGLVHVSFLCLS
jgi:hypothetical protein